MSFYDVNPADPETPPVLIGTATAIEALLGLDFNCGSIVILRLEEAQVGSAPFRVDFEVIPSGSGR